MKKCLMLKRIRAVAVLCLTIFSIGVSKLLDFDRRRVEKVEREVRRTSAKMNEIKELKSKCDAAAGEYNEAAEMLKSRNTWFDMIGELQKMIPDTMWLITLEGVGDPVENTNGGGEPAAAKTNPFQLSAASGGERGGTAASALPDLREVKRLHLVGYTLTLPGHERLEARLEAKLKESKYFESEWTLGENRRINNLSCFEIFLRLKEPIRK